ncbi:hypothetical protein [Nostoc sp. NMS4]|uniref:hypothetical protein n=1 Tax=Nostoc sp. NMS4 TaxID=2815390 RepID=UPI0025F35204|nr:hypothetical protein [Nostoc sp. NMS4]MBN3927760.1 hypothetical protein [Nostoc sp. NMS4]
MDFDSIMKMPVIGQTIAHGIEGGRDWGQTYLDDLRWCGDSERFSPQIFKH